MKPSPSILLNGSRILNSEVSLNKLKDRLRQATSIPPTSSQNRDTEREQKPSNHTISKRKDLLNARKATYSQIPRVAKNEGFNLTLRNNDETDSSQNEASFISKKPINELFTSNIIPKPNQRPKQRSSSKSKSSLLSSITSPTSASGITNRNNWGAHGNIKLSQTSTAKTTLQAKSEFDSIVQDWITTNWVNEQQTQIQHRPCHFFVHDKLLYNNFSLFDALIRLISSSYPSFKITNKSHIDQMKQLWNRGLTQFNIRDKDMKRVLIIRKFRELIKNTFFPFARFYPEIKYFINSEMKEHSFFSNFEQSVQTNLIVNQATLNELKNLSNLNDNNYFTIIKDKEFSLLNLDYQGMIEYYVDQNFTAGVALNTIKYKFNFGNKMDDSVNVENFENMVAQREDLHDFLILTNDQNSSMEYFRIIRQINKKIGDSKASKGSVVFLNNDAAKVASLSGEKFYGSNDYYSIKDFRQIYDVLEEL
ncbi:unnamed protein product [Ambrosiozyma monospora]|uniref:Unnamed protein product n=1 Tax=Ambrosiozyma monospora TaxID=43982 RepID=A0A9W7DLB8_AMBMO|nr:unnamed protein product [Ambrosiozyma monospora]